MTTSLKGRKKRDMNGKTRKINDSLMNIPELKNSFDILRKSTVDIIKTHSKPKERLVKFKKVWMDIFNLPVNAMSADAYIRVVEKSSGKRSNKTRKTKQNGGMAPLDYQTRPGVDGVHGSFPAYQSAGLAFYDTINQQGMFKGCGIENSSPSIPADMGSNKFQGGGGALSDAAFSLSTRPILSAPVPGLTHALQNAWLGYPPSPSPLTNQNKLVMP
jgi:hypothetical protein